MAISDGYIGMHFRLFDASFKEFTGLKTVAEQLDESQRFYLYVCPLCLENRMGVHQNTLHWVGKFNKDHYPPQNVGGKKTILVCESCNSKAGMDYDYILEEWLHWQAFQARVPNATLPMRRTTVSTIPGSYGGKLTINQEGDMEIDVKPHNKPIPPLDKWIEDSKTDHNYSITMTILEPVPTIVARALLKSAYLYCFKDWGHQFALSQHGQRIREVIGGTLEYPVPTGCLVNVDGEINIPEGLIFIQSPKEWQTLAVSMTLFVEGIPYKRNIVVPIPAPTATGWENLARLNKWSNPGSATMDMSVVPLPSYLDAGELYGYTKAWTDCYKP
jgi:hypothetical protein